MDTIEQSSLSYVEWPLSQVLQDTFSLADPNELTLLLGHCEEIKKVTIDVELSGIGTCKLLKTD